LKKAVWGGVGTDALAGVIAGRRTGAYPNDMLMTLLQ